MLVKLTEIDWQNFEDGNKWYDEYNLVRDDVMMLDRNKGWQNLEDGNDMMKWI